MHRKTATKQKILASAFSVFARDGYDLASTNKIAEEAGVSKGVIFKHFKSKSGLYYEIFLSELDRLSSGFDQLKLDAITDPMEKISQVILWKIEYANLYPEATKLLAEAIAKPPKEIAGLIHSHIARLGELSIQRFFGEVPMENFREEYNRSDVLRIISIAANGLQAAYVKGHPDFPFSAEARIECIDYMRIVYRGMEKSQ